MNDLSTRNIVLNDLNVVNVLAEMYIRKSSKGMVIACAFISCVKCNAQVSLPDLKEYQNAEDLLELVIEMQKSQVCITSHKRRSRHIYTQTSTHTHAHILTHRDTQKHTETPSKTHITYITPMSFNIAYHSIRIIRFR